MPTQQLGKILSCARHHETLPVRVEPTVYSGRMDSSRRVCFMGRSCACAPYLQDYDGIRVYLLYLWFVVKNRDVLGKHQSVSWVHS